jgi:hypothetical protein
MGIAVFMLAMIVAFYLGYDKSAFFSPFTAKTPPKAVTGPAAKRQNTSPDAKERNPSHTFKPDAVRVSESTAHPPKPDERQPPEGASGERQREISSAPAESPAAGDEGAGLSSKDQRIFRQLSSGDPEQIRAAARRLYQHRFDNPILLDIAAEVLKDQYRISSGSWLHVDAMAWVCKALGRSGKPQYRQLLDTVANSAPSRKLSGYARKSIRELQ